MNTKAWEIADHKQSAWLAFGKAIRINLENDVQMEMYLIAFKLHSFSFLIKLEVFIMNCISSISWIREVEWVSWNAARVFHIDNS